MQLKHLAERSDHRRGLLLKARQFGFTTLYCIDYLDEALWIPGTTSAILGHERDALDEIFQIIKRAYENLPEQLKPLTKTDTTRMYRFTYRYDGLPLDSSIYVALKLRSGTVQNLHITESAFIKDRQELNAGSKQAVPKDGRITEETTANGMNDFYDSYEYYDSKTTVEQQDYKTYFYAWFENPEYSLPGEMPEIMPEDVIIYGNESELRNVYHLTDGQLLWRRWKIRELRGRKDDEGLGLSPLQLFKQEYPATKTEAFQSGRGAVFEGAVMDLYEMQTKDPIHKINFPFNELDGLTQSQIDETHRKFCSLRDKGVLIWRLPKPGQQYVVGIDPSDGTDGGDFGCISVRPKGGEPNEKVLQFAQYQGILRPDLLGELGIEMAEFYNHAFIGVENNMLTCILHVSKNYDNYYSVITIDEKNDKRTKKIGWTTSTKTRDPMIDDFVAMYEEQEIEILNRHQLSEMKTFIKHENGRREHAVGKHDDLLFADMIAIQMRKYKKPLARGFVVKPIGF